VDFSHLRAALLDFDGTLVHLPVDWNVLRRDISALFAANGYESSFEPLLRELRAGFRALEERGETAAKRAAIRRRINRMMTDAELACAAEATVIPGAPELMREARERRWKLVIQSSNSVRCIESVTKRLGFPEVDVIVGRESSPRTKPDPAGVRAALRRLRLRGDQTVVIGDGDFDIEVGRAIGALTVRVGGEGADFCVPTLEEARRLLRVGPRAEKVAV
jgi:phosphoglycolate phosphatase